MLHGNKLVTIRSYPYLSYDSSTIYNVLSMHSYNSYLPSLSHPLKRQGVCTPVWEPLSSYTAHSRQQLVDKLKRILLLLTKKSRFENRLVSDCNGKMPITYFKT